MLHLQMGRTAYINGIKDINGANRLMKMNKEKEPAEILDAKLYLKEIGRYEKVIKNKLEELKHLRELAVSFNYNSNSDVVQNSCDADKIGSIVG